jgi:ankyrin repeat protein
MNDATPWYWNNSDALVTAAYEGDFENVKRLLELGINPNQTNEDGVTAIIAASEFGFTPTIESLLNAGADINAVANNGDTAIAVARYSGGKDTVALLIARGAVDDGRLCFREKAMDDYYAAMEIVNLNRSRRTTG